MKQHINTLLGTFAPVALWAGSVAVGTAATTAYQTAVLAKNPYAYYRLGETSGTTADNLEGTAARDGTYNGGVTLNVTSAAGDTAASFDGSDDYLAMPVSTFGSQMGQSSYEVVFRTTTTTTGYLFGTFNGSGSSDRRTAIQFALNSGSDTHLIFVRNEGLTVGNGERSEFTFNADLNDGEWHHLLLTIDLGAGGALANRFKVYVDGVGQSIAAINDEMTAANFADYANPLTLAARNVRGTVRDFVAADIDEFAIYTSTLTAADAAQHAALIPEPAGASLLGLSGLTMLMIRRRK